MVKKPRFLEQSNHGDLEQSHHGQFQQNIVLDQSNHGQKSLFFRAK